jgi:hypothetical protein
MSDNIGREIPEDAIPLNNTIDRVQAAHQAVWDNPGTWRVVAGPYAPSVARVYASQANAGTRWRSLERPADTHVVYKGWTDPDSDPKVAYVLAMAQQEEARGV